MSKNILTIGAYERDNFGDSLFFLIAKEALKNSGRNITPSSLISSDMREYIGEKVLPYDFLLSSNHWDAVWIVGGEIGGADIERALSMSLKNTDFDLYSKLTKDEKRRMRCCLVGDINYQLAYLPHFSGYEKNRDTKIIINSVGGFESLPQFKNVDLFNKAVNSLQMAKMLSVRSKTSSDYLKSLGINNNLLPDVIHALPFYYSPNEIKEVYILFQVKQPLLDVLSIETVAKNLKQIIDKYGCKVYLFIAGSARYHDSEGSYLEIKKYLNDELCESRVDIIKEKNPLRLVDWIANSKLWIGTSLHGRILSIAYGVRRISLENHKVAEYCRNWDDSFPFDVRIGDLVSTCERVMSINVPQSKNQINSLARKAKNNLDSIVNEILRD